jgi:hypothetical protein
MTTIYLFRSKADPAILAWTDDPAGTPLPNPPIWEKQLTHAVTSNRALDEPALHHIVEGIARDGYLIVATRLNSAI